MNVAEFFYTTIFRLPWIRAFVNKLILLILPASVRVGNAIVMINPRDPVISGALTFGVYEKSEILLMQQICKLGQVVIDIGANVGLYTAIAGSLVGSEGLVISVEPEPESIRFLHKTVSANGLKNTRIVQAAASNVNGQAKLFTSSVNRGDHRMYRNKNADGNIEVATLKLDDYLEKQGIHSADIIKIDVQGFEGHVIAGIEKTIRHSPHLIMLMEFWPMGLYSVGSDPRELLQQLENLGLSIYEIKKHNVFTPVIDKNKLLCRLTGIKYTNLVLLGPQAEWKP